MRTLVLIALAATACSTPTTEAVIANRYAVESGNVIFRAQWQNTAFVTSIPPDELSAPEPAVEATANTAYVLISAGNDPISPTSPLPFILLQSRAGYSLDLGDTLVIPVDDHGFAGNCAAFSTLSQEQADFMTEFVFQTEFAGLGYDAPSCTVTGTP